MQIQRQIVTAIAFATAIVLVTLAVLNLAPVFMAPILAIACGLAGWTLLLSLPPKPEMARRADPEPRKYS